MNLYTLTQQEQDLIKNINDSNKNVLLIILDMGNGNIGVDADDLQDPTYSDYLDAIGPYDSEKVIVI